MRPKHVITAIESSVNSKQPLMIWGPPGVGKSDCVRQAADTLGVKVIDVRLPLLDPVDLRGIPHVDKGDNTAKWSAPDMFPNEERDGKRGILFLDEINAAPKMTQAAAYQLVLDRKVGEYELPEGWVVIAAGNRAQDKAVVHTMPLPLTSRFTHVDYEVHLEDWTEWALNNGVRTEVLQYVRFKPGQLHDMDNAERAFPCPRTWYFASTILDNAPDEIQYEMLVGTVGKGAASELKAFIDIYRNLPNPDTIIMNPDSAEVPEEPQVLYALTGALSERATEQNFERVAKYTLRMKPEFQAVLVRDAVKRCPDIAETPAFLDWAVKNQDVLL